MTALRAIAKNADFYNKADLPPPEHNNPLFKLAVDAVFALDERGIRLNKKVKDKPYEALLQLSQELRDFGLTHSMAEEFVEAIESQAVHVGVDFTKKAKPTPMEISIYVMDKEPELSDDQDHYIVAWDGMQKFGGDYDTDTVVEMHIDGTRSTRSNVPKFEDMFKIGGKKYLIVHLKKLKDSGGQTLDEQGAELATFVEAVGPVAAGSAGGGAIKSKIESGTISPVLKELIGTVAETRNVIETAKFEAPSDKNALKIVDLNNKIVAQTHQVSVTEQIPAVVAKAVSYVMDQGAVVVQSVRNSVEVIARPQSTLPVVAMNENIAVKQRPFIEIINTHTVTSYASEPRREPVLDTGFKGGGGYSPQKEILTDVVVAGPVKERTLFGDDRKDPAEQKLSKIFEEKCKGCGGGACPACTSNPNAMNLKIG
jgi:hypothetical protein